MNGLLAFIAWFGLWTDGTKLFRDTPANHWFIEGMALAKKDGILVGYPDGLGYFPPPTRDLSAVKYLLAVKGYQTFARSLLADRETIQKATDGKPLSCDFLSGYRSDWEAFRILPVHFAFLCRAEAEFYPQVRKLRALEPGEIPTLAELRRTVNRVMAFGPAVPGQRYQEFTDVPRTHWASEAIRDLRAAGLIDGYPDQTFRG